MQIKRLFQTSCALLIVLALLLWLLPGQALAAATRVDLPLVSQNNNTAVSVAANVYLTESTLQPMIQNDISQQLPQAVSAAISNMVTQLPKADQGWATQMANALLQPSATVVSVVPQAKGLLVTLQVDLYQGDPQPTTTTLLIGLSVASATMVQVSALPIDGKSGLVSGPLLTFSIPLGSLNTISMETSCGDADLAINLKFPISLSTSKSTTSQVEPSGKAVALNYTVPPPIALAASQTDPVPSSYIELPKTSLAQLGSSMGNIAISSSLTAKNIRVGVQGKNLTLTTDIYWYALEIGTAVSTVVPGASKGNLFMQVTGTKLQILDGLISFPMNSYNQQIQQTLNSQLSGALTGKFTVSQAAVGPNTHLPCAAGDSLVLGGTITLNE